MVCKMVQINISKDKGLTQALRDYAVKNGYINDANEISKEEWDNTIFKLKELQGKRTNDKSIFKGGSNYNKDKPKEGWHENFIANEYE